MASTTSTTGQQAIEGSRTTAEGLRRAIARLPRVPLANLPTPLDDCPRLSAALGGPRIMIKRDDLTGLAFGGNKTRKLELNFGEARQRGADVVVGTAAAQSNHCRQTAAAAARLGLACHLLLRGGQKDGRPAQGNLLLDDLLGAEVRLLYGEALERWPETVAAYMEELRGRGHVPYQVMNTLESDRLGAVAYMAAFLELQEQLRDVAQREAGREAARGAQARGRSPGWIYLASLGGTGGGLALAAKLLAPEMRVVCFTPMDSVALRLPKLLAEANAAAELLGIPERLEAGDVTMHDETIGAGYGIPTAEGTQALRLVARQEGILLDPVYTAKAMAGLIDHIRRGVIGRDETVVFLHTGGLPALFAYNGELAS
jgi:1-aminocyclopropane-1-carboxylate deaminase/D-cysteine desulfhydrase-like pyridoxal-dependent ACC family enzyme